MDREEIAKRLRAARKGAGFKSAKEFATASKIPLSTYGQHESGKRSIIGESIVAYSQKLGTNPNWLLTGEGDPHATLNFSVENKNIVDWEKVYKTRKKDTFLQKTFAPIDETIKDHILLKKIFLALEPFLKGSRIHLSYAELVDFCLDIYNIVSTLSGDLEEKEKIISLTFSSLKQSSKSSLTVSNGTVD